MKTKYTIPVMVSTAVLLAACGGGGSNVASSPTTKSSFNLSGTVPGTLIEAFCEDGSYYSVNSNNNGTTQHPFSLALPKDLSCRLVMTTNENDIANKVVTPITFTDKDGVTSIAFTGTEDTNLGYVDLALNRNEMTLDTQGDGVEDEPKEVVINDPTIEVVDKANNDPLDKNNDDIIDIYEDDDGDGINNRDDDDDDNDGVKDKNDSDYDNDRDGDGINNIVDIDDDNDGLEDNDDNDDDNDGIKDEVDSDSDHDNGNGNGNVDPIVVTTPTAGRLLASQCAQCHRTDANPDKGFEDLIGEEIYGDLVEMKRENKLELMHLQANGYSEQQIRLIDDYFSTLKETKGGE
jgi:hypothetical protein